MSNDMTWRELIIYILRNDLQDIDVARDGRLLGLLTVDEVAFLHGVGPETVRVWYQTGLVKGVRIGDNLYFIDTAKIISPVKGDDNA